MPLVVMRQPGGDARCQRQDRFGPIQRLHLALLIHAQHDGTIGRFQVQAHYVPHLLHKLRVFGKLEALHTMRLQSESMPDPHDRILRQTRLLGHQASAPVRAVGWHRFQCLRNNVFNLPIGDLAWRADPRFIQ
jgi:hypothetical protein